MTKQIEVLPRRLSRVPRAFEITHREPLGGCRHIWEIYKPVGYYVLYSDLAYIISILYRIQIITCIYNTMQGCSIGVCTFTYNNLIGVLPSGSIKGTFTYSFLAGRAIKFWAQLDLGGEQRGVPPASLG